MTGSTRNSLAATGATLAITLLLPVAGWLWLRARQPAVDQRTRDRLA